MRRRGKHESRWARTLDQAFGATVGAVVAVAALCAACLFGDVIIRWLTR